MTACTLPTPVDVRTLAPHDRYPVASAAFDLLKAGDSMHFDARAPHTVENRTDREAILLYVGTPSVLQRGAPAEPA